MVVGGKEGSDKWMALYTEAYSEDSDDDAKTLMATCTIVVAFTYG
jgi:hypothetical protein